MATYRSYTFPLIVVVTKYFHAYTWDAAFVEKGVVQLGAATSAGSSSDTATLGTAAQPVNLQGASVGSSGDSATLGTLHGQLHPGPADGTARPLHGQMWPRFIGAGRP